MNDDIVLVTNVPKWARWLAQDENGSWCVYDDPPTIVNNHRQWFHSTSEGKHRVIYKSEFNPNWRDTRVYLG